MSEKKNKPPPKKNTLKYNVTNAIHTKTATKR